MFIFPSTRILELYDITERKLAYILVQKIQNAKYAVKTTDSVKSIPIADVYYAVFRNNVLDVSHFSADDALDMERMVYGKYLDYKANVYSTIEMSIRTTRTPYYKLSDEYKVYQYYILRLLMNNGIIMTSEIDSEDSYFKAWDGEGDVSLGDLLEHCIDTGLVDISRLSLDSKYASVSAGFVKLSVNALPSLVR